MSVVFFSQPVVIPDPAVDAQMGPSANNIALYTDPTTRQISALPAIPIGTTQVAATILKATYFPRNDILYRITFNYEYNILDFGTPSTPIGNVTVGIQPFGGQFLALNTTTVRNDIVTGNTRNIGGSLTAVFFNIPANLVITITNDTNLDIAGAGQMLINNFCVETVTTAATITPFGQAFP